MKLYSVNIESCTQCGNYSSINNDIDFTHFYCKLIGYQKNGPIPDNCPLPDAPQKERNGQPTPTNTDSAFASQIAALQNRVNGLEIRLEHVNTRLNNHSHNS